LLSCERPAAIPIAALHRAHAQLRGAWAGMTPAGSAGWPAPHLSRR